VKLLHLTFHFEFLDAVERILDRHGVENFVRHPMVDGRDRDGKHYGTQVFPGNSALVQAQVEDERLDALLEDLKRFRDLKVAHHHIEALVLPVERRL